MNRPKSKNRYHGRSLIADITAHLINATKKAAKNPKKKKSSMADTTNNRLQHKYIRYLREAKGRKEGTILKAEDALRRWFEFTNNKPLSAGLNDQIIVDFKDALRRPRSSGKPLSPGSRFDILLQLRSFFEWLSGQTGFKICIKKYCIEYLNPNTEEKQYRQERRPKRCPTLQQIEMLVRSIPRETILQRRDRAFISLLLLSGIRVDAAVSLSIGSIDRSRMAVMQDPQDGVRTKFSKRIRMVVMPFSNDLYEEIGSWYDELVSRGFGYQDPLFPSAEPKIEGIAYVPSDQLSNNFISSSQMRTLIKNHCLRANLPVFNPHSFRHASVDIAFSNITGGKAIKAMSLNLGHNSARQVIDTYAYMSEGEIEEIIRSLGEKK